MSNSANALSRVVTHGKAAVFLLRHIFRYGTAAEGRSAEYITTVLSAEDNYH
ncbi:hypothetical protein PAXRUDRAFT_156379 [Paxillus rubicundulus Ve08.2h10]|uniref:Uncharacterized protein n=1 Tax=Paxillus rubicundulus Ve08.2h10 TaxID=930991 RepID=A0A0D0DIE2_9AGAM|nr:hypothetical protein PAXRUDRAFT_156379 [Paxillus rubicundulus Ve08.2h10]